MDIHTVKVNASVLSSLWDGSRRTARKRRMRLGLELCLSRDLLTTAIPVAFSGTGPPSPLLNRLIMTNNFLKVQLILGTSDDCYRSVTNSSSCLSHLLNRLPHIRYWGGPRSCGASVFIPRLSFLLLSVSSFLCSVSPPPPLFFFFPPSLFSFLVFFFANSS